ncbi:MAG: histidinol dehydrogenase [Desulfatirhabdiaceae bacterium]
MNIYHYPSSAAANRLSAIIHRKVGAGQKQEAQVRRILNRIQKEGDTALIEYANRFDSPTLTENQIRVTESEYKKAFQEVDEGFMESFNRALNHIKIFHQRQKPNSWIDTERAGAMTGQLVHPVDVAGMYVPGGKGGTTPLVSSVLMGAVPAAIAGVPRIVMTTPAGPDGTVNPCLLVAARLSGVHDVFKIGSAWAIGAMAYGTQTVDRCDVIVGPGNVYVTLAKKLVSGIVGIDMIAGPSEILIVADENARPDFAAADMLSQAEHDVMASAMLITPSTLLAQQVRNEVTRQVEHLCRKDIAKQALSRYGAIFVTPDMTTAIDIANRIAPEHLELLVDRPMEWIGQIRNAGAVFMGAYTPEPVGDYMAGPNHVLPTAGSARFSSALSVENFIKRTSLIHYSRSALMEDALHIEKLAAIEGLDAHANSVAIRRLSPD